ncbi:YdaS family helix-turn-helix protein [Cedecea neteri]|uniref:transcriptional regulator n=1 Tax=Cedecea neteri TaxID=158822 RepID=UPI002AA64CCF|nr:YdaS family helix-turn-helix protein [Cedecea neteri]WPU24968.1 YdaS family helix-turn-helix protein [Cedecea neteri]
MRLDDYLSKQPRGAARDLAAQLGISKSYLSQIATGKSPASPARCIEIEKATDSEVTRIDMRPSDWREIWPEYTPPNLPLQQKGV